MAIRWKLHEGKKVLQCDYRGLSLDLSLLQLEEAACVLARCHDRVLLLSTFRGDDIDPRFIRRAHELGRTLARVAALKVALVGIGSLKYVMREAYAPLAGTRPSLFTSEQEALAWLVQESGVS